MVCRASNPGQCGLQLVKDCYGQDDEVVHEIRPVSSVDVEVLKNTPTSNSYNDMLESTWSWAPDGAACTQAPWDAFPDDFMTGGFVDIK